MTEENKLKLQVETKRTFLTPFPKHRLSAHHLAEMWEMRMLASVKNSLIVIELNDKH